MHLPHLRSLRVKMIVQIVSIGALAIVALSYVAVSRSSHDQREQIFERTAQTAAAQANHVDADFQQRQSLARTMAEFMEGNTAATRPQVSAQLKQVLVKNPTVAGTYVGYDPNAFDGRDAAFAGAKDGTTDKSGRYIPYWNRLAGTTAIEPLADMDTSAYYTQPMQQQRDVVVEPYLYDGKLLTSFVSPVIKNGKSIGIAGDDYVLTALDKTIGDIRVLKTGYAFLVTPGGLLASAPDPKLVGKATLAGLAKSKNNDDLTKIAAGIRSGHTGRLETTDPITGKSVQMFWSPVHTGGWGLVVSVPNSEILAPVHQLRRLLIIVALISLLLLGLAVALIAGRLTKPIKVFVARLQRLRENDVAGLRRGIEAMATGDLTVHATADDTKLEHLNSDEIGDAGRTLNELVDSTVASVEAYEQTRHALNGMIGGVADRAEHIGSASRQMAAVSEESGRAMGDIARAVGDVATGAESQAHRIASARDGVSQVGESVRESAAAARDTATAADQARAMATEGVEAANQASHAMEAVRDSSRGLTEAIESLSGKSEQISGIVATITGIADQTNLLALNAAIEAARAGEQGRGFAVVAEEVRKLAEESQRAAQSIGTLVTQIQDETSQTVAAVAAGAKRTEEGAATVEQTRSAFDLIGASVDDVTTRVGQIAEVAQRIAQSAEQVETDVNEIAAVVEQASSSTEEVSASTEQTSASSQQISASAQELSQTATELEELVAAFTLAPR
ncbi:MAG TPA: methyl-accepting chemotaxis protein [Baekduia sp.]